MSPPRPESQSAGRRVALYIGSSSQDAWRSIIRPWFEAHSKRAASDDSLVAVITPYRSHAHFWRKQILTEGISLLGVKFLTPPQLRDLLLRKVGAAVPLREHLRFLLAATAESVARSNPEEEASNTKRVLLAKSIARDPDNFLRTLDQLGAAGWNLDAIDSVTLREIATDFQARVRDCGFTFVHQADRAAAAESRHPPLFANLLIIGFDGAHWPIWPLLCAAASASSHAGVVLNDPRDEARDLDETWVGTWEEYFGTAQTIAGTDSGPTSSFKNLFDLHPNAAVQKSRAAQPISNIHFIVGRNNVEQARAIVALTAKFLADERCERIGLLFARAGSLPRLVANFLQSARIPHNDSIAHLSPNVFDRPAYRTWLDLQQIPRLKSLLRFLRASDLDLFEGLSTAQVEEALRRVHREVLLDHLDILREACVRNLAGSLAPLAKGLSRIELLPENGGLADFLSATRTIFTAFAWKEHWSEIDRLSRNWSARCPGQVSKAIYLRWLGELLAAPSLTRDDFGAHPYSRVQLLPYDEAEGQWWSHLIFAGLNDEAWPAIDGDVDFVPEQQISEFNDKALNRRAVMRGRQGEGHRSIRDDKTLLLGPHERRALRRRQLLNLIESVDAAIGVSANLYSEAFPSRLANPTEFFSWLYFIGRGEGVSQQTLHTLEEQTRAWLRDWSVVDAQKVDSISVGRTRYAFDARRQIRAAGEYEFALRRPPETPTALRVTEWEQTIRSPALVWMKVFLGVAEDGGDGDAWPVATGQWVHRWLATAAQSGETSRFVDIARTDKLRSRLAQVAREFRDGVHDLGRACDKKLPDWWISGWANALHIADCLGAKLSDLNDWSHLAVEWPLGSPAIIPVTETAALRVRGRIDLILARGESDGSPLRYSDLWLVDYKTGRQRAFTLRERRRNESPQQRFHRLLVKGKGIQLALYALAAHALGAAHIRLTLLGTMDDLKPNFTLEDALAQNEFWRELCRMQETGVFGMLGQVHNDYGLARPYPLATLPIDPDLLEEKWTLTHPAFGAPEDGTGES